MTEDRTQTPQAAAGVPDHSQTFLLAGKYLVPYLSLSFNEDERNDLLNKKLTRMTQQLTLLTTQEQLDRADEFDEREAKLKDEGAELWVAFLTRRMGRDAPAKDEFLENVGSRDITALAEWMRGVEGKAVGESSPIGTTSLPD